MRVQGTMRVEPPITPEDTAWLKDLWLREWGGETMVSKGIIHHVSDACHLLAFDGSTRIGVATYLWTNGECELLSLNAIVEGRGVGTALLTAVEDRAREAGLRRVWLITSNDNLDALRFYQRRGYRMVAVHVGAIDEARRVKPTIPAVGYYEIPIHDEVELEKVL